MKKLALSIVLVVAVLMAWLLVRTCLRYRTVNMVLSQPGVRQRMAIIPTHRTFSYSTNQIQSINLGYATFDVGLTGLVLKVSAGKQGTCILISNTTAQIVFMAPFSPEELSGEFNGVKISDIQAKFPKTAELLRDYTSDLIQAEIRAENRQAASLWELAWMTEDQFLLYTICIEQKIAAGGGNEVIYFENPYSKGLIRTVKSPTDRRFSSINLSSLNRQCHVGCKIKLTETSEQDSGKIADHIARSFRFSIEAVPTPVEIAHLVEQAGIKKLENDQ